MKSHTPSRLCRQTLRKAADNQSPLVIGAASNRNAKRWNSNLRGSCHQAVASASAILRRHNWSGRPSAADPTPQQQRSSSHRPRLERPPPLAAAFTQVEFTLPFIEFREAGGFSVCAKRGKVCALIPIGVGREGFPDQMEGKILGLSFRDSSFFKRLCRS
jgi:hypothetical protein